MYRQAVKKLQSQLPSSHTIVKMKRDGACFFHSILHQLHHLNIFKYDHHSFIRKDAVAFLRDQPNLEVRIPFLQKRAESMLILTLLLPKNHFVYLKNFKMYHDCNYEVVTLVFVLNN